MCIYVHERHIGFKNLQCAQNRDWYAVIAPQSDQGGISIEYLSGGLFRSNIVLPVIGHVGRYIPAVHNLNIPVIQ